MTEIENDIVLTPTNNQALSLSSSNTYLHAATSENTRRAYRLDIQHFMAWGGRLPCTPDVIIHYLHHYAAILNPRTLSRRLTAIKHWHTYQGFSDPTSHPLIRKTLTGIQNIHGKPKEKAPALTVEQLTMLVKYLQYQNTLSAWRNNALIQLGFFGAFRRSELVQIQYEHLNFVEEGVEVLIPRSKTDQSGEGQTCAIPNGNQILCPVNTLKIWCEKANIKSGYLFRVINRSETIENKSLTPESVNIILKKIAKACALPHAEKISAHSLRRGFATETSRKGAPFVAIMRHGRWKHEKTVLGYIEEGQRFVENPVNILYGKEKE